MVPGCTQVSCASQAGPASCPALQRAVLCCNGTGPALQRAVLCCNGTGQSNAVRCNPAPPRNSAAVPLQRRLELAATDGNGRLADGKPDRSYFAPDCFHYTEKGHEGAAVGLWNNLFQARIVHCAHVACVCARGESSHTHTHTLTRTATTHKFGRPHARTRHEPARTHRLPARRTLTGRSARRPTVPATPASVSICARRAATASEPPASASGADRR